MSVLPHCFSWKLDEITTGVIMFASISHAVSSVSPTQKLVEYVINLLAKHCLASWQENLCFNLLERIRQWLMNPLKLKHPEKFLYATDYML